jgi:hypothetical protein
MEMKKMRRVAADIILIAMIITGYSRISFILSDKTGYCQDYDFVHDKSPVDVVILGTSESQDCISPIVMWRDYGITSYNLSVEGNFMDLNKPILQNAMHYHKPQIAVIDVDKLVVYKRSVDPKKEMGDLVACRALDGFPISYTKIKSVLEFTDDKQARADILLHFPEYHNKWKNILPADINLRPEINHTKGCKQMFINYSDVGTVHNGMPEEIRNNKQSQATVSDDVKEYHDYGYLDDLRELVRYCKSNNIKPLLIKVPFIATADEKEQLKYAEIIAKAEKVPFVNMVDKNVVNYDIDCYDKDHLNFSGENKVSEYLGRYLHNNYRLKDHRGDPQCVKSWKKCEDMYNDDIERMLVSSRNSFYTYSMLLTDNNLRCDLRYNGEIDNGNMHTGLLQDAHIKKIINDKTVPRGKIRLAVYLADSGQKVDESEFYLNDIAHYSCVGMEKK